MTVAETLQFFAVYDKAIEFCGGTVAFSNVVFFGQK